MDDALGSQRLRLDYLEHQSSLFEAALGRFAAPGDPYALVDFPFSSNIGDSAIWLGAAATLHRLTGRGPVYVCAQDTRRLKSLRARLGKGTIYITGGGNLGDLWPGHQRLRETLLERFRGNRIVQLPQSIHFGSPQAVQRCAAAIKGHGSFHLMVRDQDGLKFAERHFDCPVMLVPDCAFALGPLQPSRDPRRDLVCLLRTDKERLKVDLSPIEVLQPKIEDWLREPRLARPMQSLWVRTRRISTAMVWSSAIARLFERSAKRRVARGVSMLSNGRQVVTDRLHGHILCLLLGIPHVVLADSGGKIAAYRRTWPNPVPDSVLSDDAVGAVSALARLARRRPHTPTKKRAA